METDDWELLQSLVHDELVVLTPSHAHDDFYVIDYAVKNDGFIVTNDMFRDHVENKRVFQGRRLTQKWVRARCIDFTFVGNEFLPNSQAIERIVQHIPQPNCPHGTLAASESPRSSTSQATAPRLKDPTSLTSSLRRSASQETKKQKQPLEEQDNDEEDDDANAMSVDQVRKKNVDLSEMTAYRVPRHLLPLLHGDDGQTMGRFQDHTGTYIVVPNSAVSPASTNNVATLTIYGAEPNRMQAVKILDAALPDLQRQFEYQQHQLWLQSQPHHFQPQHLQEHQHQHQQLMDEASAYQLQQQQLHQLQFHHHRHHPHYHQADEHMEMDVE